MNGLAFANRPLSLSPQFLTLVPSTISLEKASIRTAIAINQWVKIDDNYQYVVEEVNHY